MSVDFQAPSYRAGGSDLTISISPLGLVELADEEFEVHGPRLNRYSHNWAFYLGHHWGYRRELGEPQVTFNYVKAFTDFILNFVFGRGVTFKTPVETSGIVPDLLARVWERDNDKHHVLYEMGQQGGVSGDCFVKVAYEEAYEDTAGRPHPGRVRILPLNSSYCFPEFHPHDRDRLIRFKLKYRFWGTSLEGTRQVFTYTELLTDDVIEEYVNDELIDARPNPLGVIPVVHIPNTLVSGSPWGLGDCHDILTLNREYNEKATDISDIINYHAAPVTVITGAKAAQLEKGPKKVWGGLPKDAQVFNLELQHESIAAAMLYLDTIKRSMHEMTGVPETALGQMQPISNTSGVALSIMFQPLMNRWRQKVVQYAKGLERVNEFVLLTLALKEPDALIYDPSMEGNGELADGQLPRLDPHDPVTYVTTTHFLPPLPLDELIVLQAAAMKQQLGVESKKGILDALGEESPIDKLEEIREEQRDDALADGALALLHTQIQAEILSLTGMLPNPDGAEMPPTTGGGTAGGPGGGTNSQPKPQEPQPTVDHAQMVEMEGEASIRNQLVTKAYGTKIPLRKKPDGDD